VRGGCGYGRFGEVDRVVAVCCVCGGMVVVVGGFLEMVFGVLWRWVVVELCV
jgi:hypothetical protein